MGKERALITGGSVGIGAALADVFAAHGHDLILVSRNPEKLEARGRAIREQFNVDVVCLPEDKWDAWLDPAVSADEATSMLVPIPSSELRAYPVVKLVSNVASDGRLRNVTGFLETV